MPTLKDFDLSPLEPFPHIKSFIEKNWCSVRLKGYLEALMSDTRNGSRQGFPAEVSKLLLLLSNKNIDALEDIGVEFNDLLDDNGFGNTKWDLPPNF